MKNKKKQKKKEHSFFKRISHSLWKGIQGFFNFFGNVLVNLSRKWRLSISFKITFTFVVLTYFFLSLFAKSNFLMTLVGIPLIAIFGKRAVTYLLKPIDDMTLVAKELSVSDLKRRIDLREAHDELRDMAETLNSMLDRIEKGVEEQKTFISHASHELRTPLSVIKGYSDLLERWGKENPSVRDESIEAIRKESESMRSLVEKLLMISRMEYGGQILERHLLSLDDLLKESCEEFRIIKGESPALELALEEVHIEVDALLIKELIRILLDNAYKYTPEKNKIYVSCGKSDHYIYMSVRDTGIGIDSKHLEHLFDSFYRADDSRNKKTGGSGLGLSIAKKICDLHKASIRIASEPGEGTLVIVNFSLDKNKENKLDT